MSVTVLGCLESSDTRLPLYDFRLPCGFPSPAQDHLERQVSLDELVDLRAPHTYVIQVSGDSMTGAGIFAGDLVIVDRARPARVGDIVVAVRDREPTLKRLGRRGSHFVLLAENPAYAPLVIGERDDFEVWGVATHSLRRFGHG